MTEEDYMETVTELIQEAVLWAGKKYRVRASGVVDRDDLQSHLWMVALSKRDKLQPQLEAGKIGYVVSALRNGARDALAPEWKHQKEAGPTLESVEAGEAGKTTKKPTARKLEAGKNPSSLPPKIERNARGRWNREVELTRQVRYATALLATLNDVDAEIFRLHIGNWRDAGATPAAIALQMGLGVSTVYRRLAAIKKRFAEALSENSEPSL